MGYSASGTAQWVDDPTAGLSLEPGTDSYGGKLSLKNGDTVLSSQVFAGDRGVDVYYEEDGPGYMVIGLNLKSGSSATYSSNTPSNTSGKQYPVVPDKDGKLSVNVPWSDTHHTAYLRAGSSGGTSNSSVSNPYINLVENSSFRSGVRLNAGTNMSISSSGGTVTFNAAIPDTVYNWANIYTGDETISHTYTTHSVGLGYSVPIGRWNYSGNNTGHVLRVTGYIDGGSSVPRDYFQKIMVLECGKMDSYSGHGICDVCTGGGSTNNRCTALIEHSVSQSARLFAIVKATGSADTIGFASADSGIHITRIDCAYT